MSVAATLPNHLRPKREKVFGLARGFALDRNAKVRIIVYAKAWNAKHKQPGQHRGALTRATMEVLHALLWGFHNSKTGLCFPSYEAIAAKAECCRDTVYEAIKALERADVLTWVNRIMREQVHERDLFGKWVTSWRLVRTSNAYTFRDPLPCAAGRPSSEVFSKSENPPGTLIQDISIASKKAEPSPLPPDGPLSLALARLANAIAAKTEQETALSAA